MRTILLGLLAVAGIAIATPVVSPASAQVRVETPAGDVRVGGDRDRDRDRDRDGDHDRRRYHRDRHHGCHTVTIRRDDGSVRRIRRCD
jgi:Ni/Co efflux regulator RcnB